MAAEDLRRDLEKVGARVVGPVPSVADALRRLARDDVIDVNLRGERAYPVADALRERGIPFVLATGYEQWALPEADEGRPGGDKPVDLHHLARALFE